MNDLLKVCAILIAFVSPGIIGLKAGLYCISFSFRLHSLQSNCIIDLANGTFRMLKYSYEGPPLEQFRFF